MDNKITFRKYVHVITGYVYIVQGKQLIFCKKKKKKKKNMEFGILSNMFVSSDCLRNEKKLTG